ncbi:MAG TPA: hypothetical protein VD993_03395 [Chitinophagaceae bacterium]|nr:hypothetical protein [Chitinophagaceae bacterium]
MTEQIQEKKPDYTSIIRRQRTIILILSFLLIATAVLYLFSQPAAFDDSKLQPKFRSRIVDTTIAHPNMKGYRDRGAYLAMSRHPSAKVRGILHDTPEFQHYITTKFNAFVTTHPPKAGYEWKVGIYPMMCKPQFEGAPKPRIGFYLIPTMVKMGVPNPGPGDIIDYMDAMANADLYKIYFPPTTGPAPMTDNEFIFDEGHLWP